MLCSDFVRLGPRSTGSVRSLASSSPPSVHRSDGVDSAGWHLVAVPPGGFWRAVVGDLEDASYDLVCPRCWPVVMRMLAPGVTVQVLRDSPVGAQCARCDADAAC